MSTANEFGFDYVYELAKKLSPEQQTELVEKLTHPDDESPGFIMFTVDTGNPIFSEEDFARFEKNRQALLASIDWEQAEKNRQELIRLAAECPVASEEEIEMQNEIREAMRRWKV